MYAHVKSVLMAVQECEKDQTTLYTQMYQKLNLCGSCLYIVPSDGRFFQPLQVIHGPNAAELFLDQVMATSVTIRQYLKKIIPMGKLTQKQQSEFHGANDCHICWKMFTSNWLLSIFSGLKQFIPNIV